MPPSTATALAVCGAPLLSRAATAAVAVWDDSADFDRDFYDVSFGIPYDVNSAGNTFSSLLKSGGVRSVRLPSRSPNLNAYAERFVVRFGVSACVASSRWASGTCGCW